MLLRSFYVSVTGRVTEMSTVVIMGLKPLGQYNFNFKTSAPNWPDSFKTHIGPVSMSNPLCYKAQCPIFRIAQNTLVA